MPRSRVDEDARLEQLDAFRGRLPADFRFDRTVANERLKHADESAQN